MSDNPGAATAAPTTASDSAGPAVRVRFCPSPTGTPHVGLIRTALYNWAHARHTGGRFVFRIEDTDTARDSEESYRELLDALDWLGLDWDEGVEVGGPHGPYRQSERMDIYRQVADKLLAGGYAYESFSTPEEVEARHRAAGRDPKLGYDGYDRDLTDEQKAAFRDEGREPVLRVRMPDEDVSFTDLVRGEVSFRAGSIPDFVIVRGNGQPLYTLTNPVDDALMGITHVLRGEDLLSSTPRQIALYRALLEIGIAQVVPVFAHLPMVLGEGSKKLSKRAPESNLFIHRERGFTPEGLLNYLALLGWGISPDNDIFTKEEMVAAFDVADVNPNPARFDLKKAEAINGAHVRLLAPEDFRARLVPYLHAADVVSTPSWGDLGKPDQEILEKAAPLVQERMTLLGEAPGMLGFLFATDDQLVLEEDAVAALRPEAADVLDAALAVLEPMDEFTTESVESALRAAIVEGMGIKPRHAFTPLRVAVTGRRVSPPLFESMEILGAESAIARLRALRARLAESA
ncbi:glutamate--tRNA ligase [Georgenia halophila]